MESPRPNEPPPAYEAVPSSSEQTIEAGPRVPFQHVPAAPPPPGPPPSHAPPSLPPPSFPFWNGASLTPAQTGFQPGPPGHEVHSKPYFLPDGCHRPYEAYEPTTVPTAGHPLLSTKSELLVYPRGFVCPKCNNVGFKGNDPRSPCKKCWSRYGKPYTGAVRLAVTSGDPVPDNFQRPWFPTQRYVEPPRKVSALYPAYQPRAHPNIVNAVPANPIVVRPGDPRLGGIPCPACGGSGERYGFLFDVNQCTVCFGVGRVY